MLLIRIADIKLLFKSESPSSPSPLRGEGDEGQPDTKRRTIKIGYLYKDFIQAHSMKSLSPSPQSSPQKGEEAKKKVPSPQWGEGLGEGGIIDCTISIEHHPLPFNIKGKEIFSHPGPWRLYRSRNGYKIAFFSPLLGPDYYMLLESNMDFSRSKLYIKDLRKKTFMISHPLDQLLMINLLSRKRGLFVHACGINDNGRGFVFLGASQEGKSTTAKLWLRELDSTVLSDDRIIIRKMDGRFYAYGTPWHGEVNVANPGRVEVERIFFLQHSKKSYMKQLSPIDAATRMFVRCFPTFWDKEGMAFTLKFIDEVVRKVPCYEFGFVPDKSAVEFVRGLR